MSISIYDCGCPPDNLTPIDDSACKIRKPQVQFLLFRKQGNTSFINATNGIEERNSWLGLFDAADATLVVRTPNTALVEIPEADTIEGDPNYQGATTVDAVLPQTFNVTIHNPTPLQTSQMDTLFCSGSELEVAIVYADDSMQVVTDRGTPVAHDFFPISPETFITKPPQRDGTLGAKFKYMLSFSLDSGWYSSSDFVKPEDGFSFVKDLKQGLV